MIILPNNFKNTLSDKNISISKKADKLIQLLKNKNFSELEKIDISIKDIKLIEDSKLKVIKDLLNRQALTDAQSGKLPLLKEKIKNISKQKNFAKNDIKEETGEKNISKNIDKTTIKNIKDNIIKIEKAVENILSNKESFTEDISNGKKIFDDKQNFKMSDIKATTKKVKNLFDTIKTSFRELDKTFDFAKQKELIKDIANNLEKVAKEIASKSLTNILKDKQVDKIIKDIDESISKLNSFTSENLNKPAKVIEKRLDEILYKALKNGDISKLKIFNSSKINSQLDNLTKEIKDIENLIKTKHEFKRYTPLLKKFTADIENIDLQTNIKNSGVFFESKLKEIVLQKESKLSEIENDLKNILQHIEKDAKTSGEKTLLNHTQKAISHIETLQLNSVINSSINLFIPFDWEDLKNGSLSISRHKERNFSCRIDLNLKKLGKIDILMLLNGNDISIGIDAKDERFKDILVNNKNILSKMLKSIKLNPHIFFHIQQKDIYNEEDEINLGMDIKA